MADNPARREKSGLCFGCFRHVVDHAVQILHTRSDTVFRRYFRGAKLYVLFDDRPAGIAVLEQSAEERREIDVSLPDDGEDLVFNGFLEGPFVAASLFENFRGAIFDVNETQLGLELLRFLHGVAMAVNAMAGIEAKAHVRVRGSVEKA